MHDKCLGKIDKVQNKCEKLGDSSLCRCLSASNHFKYTDLGYLERELCLQRGFFLSHAKIMASRHNTFVLSFLLFSYCLIVSDS